MNEYRAVILATIIITLALGALMLFLDQTGALVVGAFVLMALGLGDMLGTAYVIKLVLEDKRRPRSWLLLFLTTGAIFITIGFNAINWLIIRRIRGEPPLEGTAGIVITALGLILIGAVPIMKAVLFYIVRHSRKDRGDRLEDAA